jgi:hypothetical protein
MDKEKKISLKNVPNSLIKVAGSVWLSLFIEGSGKCKLPFTSPRTCFKTIFNIIMVIFVKLDTRCLFSMGHATDLSFIRLRSLNMNKMHNVMRIGTVNFARRKLKYEGCLKSNRTAALLFTFLIYVHNFTRNKYRTCSLYTVKKKSIQNVYK